MTHAQALKQIERDYGLREMLRRALIEALLEMAQAHPEFDKAMRSPYAGARATVQRREW